MVKNHNGSEAGNVRLFSVNLGLSVLAMMGFASSSYASLLLSGGLNPGDHYRIIYVTSATRDALSSNISDYNAFVNSVANAGGSDLASLGATWVVVGSTPTLNALTNVGPFTTALYNTAGLLVASDSTVLWSGTLSNAVGYDENGNSLIDSADTGTNFNGTGASGVEFGGGSGLVLDGQTGATGSNWVAGGLLPQAYNGRHFYGISSDLTFGQLTETVPEPGTFGLIAMAAILTVGAGQRRRRNS